MKNDLVIDALTIGRDSFLSNPKGITKAKLIEELTKHGHDLNLDINIKNLAYVMTTSFFLIPNNNNIEGSGYSIKLEAYFNLLEFEELREARESAKQANKHANWALYLTVGFSIASIIVAVICTHWQITAGK
jgi:hypothetical protein